MLADGGRVPRVAVGQPAEAGVLGVPASRQHLGGQEVPVRRDRRRHLLQNHRAALLRPDEGVHSGQMAVEVRDRLLHEVRHRRQPVGQAGAVPLRDGLQHRRQHRQPRREVVGQGHVAQRHEQTGHGGQEQGADRELQGAALDLPGQRLGLVRDDPLGDPVGLGQALVRHGLGPLGQRADGGVKPLLGGLAEVGEAVVVPGHAHEAGADREAVQDQLEEGVGEVGDR